MTRLFLFILLFCSVIPATGRPGDPRKHTAGSRLTATAPHAHANLRYPVRGIDISRYQLDIDWTMIRKNAAMPVHFVFIKATDGASGRDDHFQANWRKAKAAGLVRGAYHFFYPTQDPLQQARNFEQAVHLRRGDLPPVLDIERSGNLPEGLVRQAAKRWLNEITRKYHIRPIIYTDARFYQRYLGKDFDRYPLWIPDYGRERPAPGKRWAFWQCSNCKRIDGISTAVDYNLFNGSRTEFKRMLIP